MPCLYVRVYMCARVDFRVLGVPRRVFAAPSAVLSFPFDFLFVVCLLYSLRVLRGRTVLLRACCVCLLCVCCVCLLCVCCVFAVCLLCVCFVCPCCACMCVFMCVCACGLSSVPRRVFAEPLAVLSLSL